MLAMTATGRMQETGGYASDKLEEQAAGADTLRYLDLDTEVGDGGRVIGSQWHKTWKIMHPAIT